MKLYCGCCRGCYNCEDCYVRDWLLGCCDNHDTWVCTGWRAWLACDVWIILSGSTPLERLLWLLMGERSLWHICWTGTLCPRECTLLWLASRLFCLVLYSTSRFNSLISEDLKVFLKILHLCDQVVTEFFSGGLLSSTPKKLTLSSSAKDDLGPAGLLMRDGTLQCYWQWGWLVCVGVNTGLYISTASGKLYSDPALWPSG